MESFEENAQTPGAPRPVDAYPIATGAGIVELDTLREETQTSNCEARQGLVVLDEILNQLPVGVRVQAKDGKILYANETAATQYAPVTELFEQRPVQDWVTPVTTEEHFPGRSGARTLLTTHKPVRIRDELLLLSTSIDITDRKQAENELTKRANFDELTGLPNRFQFQERVELILTQPPGRFALAFIDIDNFKQINDYYSHAIGDEFLIKAAKRIANNIRTSDLLARISGDEFLLLLNPLECDDAALEIINKITEALKKPFIFEGLEIFSSASAGVSIYPEHGRNYEMLRRNADIAMYQIKRERKGGVAIFDHKIRQSTNDRAQAEQRLRLAIQDRRFRCAFQPKVDINTEEIVGVEALVRLVDEDGEIYGPSSFIELASELGLLDEITYLLVCEISKSIDLINEAFGPQATISINVSAKQATNADFMRSFIETLRETNRVDRFIVEVTEDAFVAKDRFLTQILPMLREIGVRVSIDDFGTGYSSLSALADIIADEIKIDRSLIESINERLRNQIILKMIEFMSSALGMTVIAEGVETFEELAYLRSATKIRYVQGYYFSRPLLLEDFSSVKAAVAERRITMGSREWTNKRGTNRRSR
jgi:c-di-GMP phosphodiesterase Gmr